ncbi:cilia- and flagella-associated protein 57-like [Pangasianodon hypophthalmus]|uniref:cilia- and flagella-associated protein 57-like n=1 Tax=Pangasianodon hypophthalmus TaxID=310915 RepID=UPI002306E9DA|nr:cilia- and flagella-associated protein 57-like [Pangasianodon hypophthalmus]
MSSGGISPQIQPCHIFGVCKGVRNNLLFPDEETVIFPSGNHCVRYHVHQRWTEFIHDAKGSKGMQALALSPDRRYLAVSESGKWGTITIFDLEDEKCCKRWVLKGSDFGVEEFVCMAFSADSKYLLGQAGGPTWTLFYWQWEEKELIATVKTTKDNVISQVSFNPQDDTQICVSGKGVFKIFELKNGFLRQANSYKMEHEEVLCHTWMSGDCIIAGTEAGKLLMLKSRHLHKLGRPYERQTEERDSSSSPAVPASVTAITRYSKGFACSAGLGLVCLYEKTMEKDNYRKTAEIRIPADPYSNQPRQAIATMCISPAEETLAISTDQGQLYHISLTSTEISESKEAQFEFLSHSLHSKSITGLSICKSKPLISTCSKDCTVHIWNYRTNSLEQFKLFDEEPLCVSMHPNGLSILVGFSTEVCLMNLLSDNIRTVQTFATSNCTECVFNHDGNMFAAVNKNVIHIYNIRTGEKLDLNGHRKKVQTVKWSNDDRRLVSCGIDGAVYVWNTLTGDYENRNETKCSYTDVTFSPNTGSVLAVDHFNLKEIHNERIRWEMASDGVTYTAISMTRSGQTVFIGTAAGTVRVIEYPFGKETTWTEHLAHSGPITKMVVTPGDQYLLTASEDGTLLIWTITGQEGRTMEMVKEIDYAEEVLCTKAYLDEKDQTIHELKSHIKGLKVEHEYKLNVKDMDCNKKMNNITQNYLQQIEALKDQIQVLTTEKENQRVCHQKALTEMKEKHSKELKDKDLSYSGRMILEYDKYRELEQKMQKMQQKHEKNLHEAEDSHLRAMEDRKQAYEARLQELQAKLEWEVKNSEEKQMKIKDNAESELMEICHDYDHDLQVEKETKLRVQCDMKLMERKISRYWTMKREINDQGFKICKLEEEVKNLRDQLKNATNNIEDLTKEMEEQSKIISDRDRYIEELHETIEKQEMSLEQKQEELVKMILESKKHEEESKLKSDKERSEVERLEKEVQENKETFKEIAADVVRVKKKNEEIIGGLKQKLKSKDKALLIERHRVRTVDVLVQRMKGDIQNCARFIQEPKKLKESFSELHARYVHKPDVTIEVDAEVMQEHTMQMEHFQKILDSQKTRQAKEIKHEKARYSKIVKESGFLIEQLKEQKLSHQQLLISLKKNNVQCVKTAASSAILLDESRPVVQLQRPVNQRLKRNLLDKRQSQIFALQSSSGHDKLPPIITTKKTR